MNRRGNKITTTRCGRVSSTKRKFIEELDGSEVSTSPKKNKTSKTVKPHAKKLSIRNGLNKNYDRVNKFGVGDIVLAKTGKYPIWPGIVINDPESSLITKSENNVPMIHIYYCNDAFKRNWIRLNQVSEFKDKATLLENNPKLTSQISRAQCKTKWNRATDEAECLAAMDKDQRITAFFDNNFVLDNKLENQPQINISKNKPTVEVSTPKKEKPPVHNTTDAVASTSQDTQNNNQNTLNQVFDVKRKPKDEVSASKKGKLSVHNTTDAVASTSQDTQNNDTDTFVQKSYSNDHPRNLIPELCKLFYSNGWVTGTGGGISIKYKGQIFIAPSGVQKERIVAEDLFVQDINGKDITTPPPEKHLSKSQCTPLFMCSYTERNAGAVIHVHSLDVVKLCLLTPGKELRIRDFEMIKGIFNEEKGIFFDNDEEVVIPIIENSKYEKDLVSTFKAALKKYPTTSAILVRNHGMYVWGKDWRSAKTQCECYEYIFNLMIFKKTNNV